jgi:hypothetical protein
MSHASAPAEVTGATISPRLARVVAIAGGVVTLAGLTVYGWLIYQGINHPDALMALGSGMRKASERSVKHGTSDFDALVSVSFVGILVGAFCLGLADVARRRTRPASYTRAESNISGNGFQYPVRPIGWGWQILWIVLFAGGWALSYAVPNSLGTLEPTAAGYNQLLLLLMLPLMVTSAACFATIASLVKKLSYQRQMNRHPEKPIASKHRKIRTFLFLWRGDLGLASIGGLLAGVSIWPATTGAAVAAVGFAFWGMVWLAAGVVMGQNYWRTGEPLATVTVSRAPANGSLTK